MSPTNPNSQNQSTLKIGHINISYIESKIHEVVYILKDSPRLDILGITESHLSSKHDSSIFQVPDYTMIRKDPKFVGETGIVVYIKNDIMRFSKRREDLESLGTECVWLEIKLPGNKPFFLGTIYRNPNKSLNISTWYENVTNMIDKVTDERRNLILMGDLNIDLLKPHTSWSTYYKSCGLVQLINEPTRVATYKDRSTSTLIDHIYTNSIETIHHSNVIKTAASDHFLVQCQYKFREIRNKKHVHTYIKVRSYKNFDKDLFLFDLSKVSFDQVFQIPDPEQAIEAWYSIFLPVLDRHAPLRTKRVKQKDMPTFVTHEIRQLMRERDDMKQKFGKKDRRYKKLRNKVTEAVRQTKKQQAKESIDRDKTIMNVWRVMNEITGKSRGSPNKINFSPEELNDYFLSLAKTLQGPKQNLEISDELIKFSEDRQRPKFTLPYLTVYEVGKMITKLQSKRSCGPDNINAFILKLAVPYIVESLTYVYNQCIYKSVFPATLKMAKVVPIPKTKSPQNPSDYRPISLLPVVSKPLERHIKKHMNSYIEQHQLFYPYQSGFRKNHSCQTALIRLCDTWYREINKSKLVGAVFLDLKKAFDLVDHDILIAKLKIYLKDENITTLLTSYLSNRSQYVHDNGISSPLGNIICGVPQGSILGPLLFCLFINDLPLCLKGLRVLCDIFADDNSLHSSDKNLGTIQSNLQEGLTRIDHWCKTNRMMLNPTKTKSMVITTRQKHQIKPLILNLSLNNQLIEQVDSHRVLGVIIDNKFTWDSHISHICKIVARNTYLLKQLSFYVELEHLKKFFHAHCMSHINYASTVWAGADEVHMKPLNSIHRRAIKILCPTQTVQTDEKFKTLGILPLDKQHDYNTAIAVFKTRCGQYPQYLSSFLVKCTDRYGSQNYISPLTNMDLFKNSFSFSGPLIWNSLPSIAKSKNSLSTFKTAAHQYLQQ